jgi:RNA polymerase sigma factor (sigma-70 family)
LFAHLQLRVAPPRPEPPAHADLSVLARGAAAGDERSWTELVHRLDGVLRAVVRGYRLAPADVDDVVQTTWLRALRKVAQLDEPAAIAGWLIVMARREAMRALQRGVREVVCEDPCPVSEPDHRTPEAIVLEREREAVVRDAVTRLPERQRRLLDSMLQSPAPTYGELSDRLCMPVGSIGPTRDRALVRLREDLDAKGW